MVDVASRAISPVSLGLEVSMKAYRPESNMPYDDTWACVLNLGSALG